MTLFLPGSSKKMEESAIVKQRRPAKGQGRLEDRPPFVVRVKIGGFILNKASPMVTEV